MTMRSKYHYGKIFLMIKNIASYLRDFKNYYFPPKNPFGVNIQATKDYYLSIFEKAKNEKFLEVEKLEKSSGFKIDKSWLDELALHTKVVKKDSAINYQHGRILYSKLREYIKEKNINFINIVEIGTARGFSSICMSKAINDAKVNGKIITIDIIPNDIKIFWNCIDDFESKKTRKELLKNWQKEYNNISFLNGPSFFVLKKILFDRIHFAYIDGMHDYLNTKREFEFISSRQQFNDIIIFDDYSKKFPGIIKLVEDIRNKKNYNIEILTSTEQRSYVLAQKLK